MDEIHRGYPYFRTPAWISRVEWVSTDHFTHGLFRWVMWVHISSHIKKNHLENHDFYMLETLKRPSSTIVDGSTSVKSLLNSHSPPSVTIKARCFPWFFSLHHEIPAWPRFFGHKHCHPKVMWPLSPKSGQGLVSCCPRRGSVALGLQQVFVGNVLPFFCILVFPTKWGNDPFDTCS